jgi:Zn-dependent peptidase ImmA (M78 family)
MARAYLVETAADLRMRAGQHEPAYSTRKIIGACFPDVMVTGGTLPDGVDEMVSRRPEGAVIVYSRAISGPAQRFAIAHALAHLLFDDDRARARPGCLGLPFVERRADCFARELLAPLVELAPYVGRWPSADPVEHELYLDMVDEIASHFVLPASVIQERIRELQQLTSL